MNEELKTLTTQVRNLTKAVKALKSDLAIQPFSIRNDRDAATFCGFKSVWRFSLWATKHGLKPAVKAKQHERTVYLVADLRKTCEADKAAQFKG